MSVSIGPSARRVASEVLLVVNPRAGSADPGAVRRICEAFAATRATVKVLETPGVGLAGDLLAHPSSDRCGLLVTYGGDGTVGEVVSGLLDREPRRRPELLVLPGGTGNSNYLAHWGERSLDDAVATVCAGRAHRRQLDVAVLDGSNEVSLLGVCSGLIAEALKHSQTVPERGRLRYQVALARAAAIHRPYPGRVVVDGQLVHEGPTVLANVGGGRIRGGTYRVLPKSRLDDGLLDVCVVGEGCAPGELPALMLGGTHIALPEVRYARGRHIRVERTDGEPLCFERDGELRAEHGRAFTAVVRPGAVPVLCAGPSDGAPE